MKKLSLRFILWALYALTIAVGALASTRLVALATPAEDAATVTNVSRGYYKEWYESTDGCIVLKLENHIPGYAWKLGTSNDDILKTTDTYYDKYGDRFIVLTPVDGEEGDVVLTAACMKDVNSKPIDRRQLFVSVRSDGSFTVREKH